MTPKQKTFVREYLVDFNGAQAAIRAGYSKNTANRIASENLQKDYIIKEINKQIKINLSKLDEAGLRLLRLIEHGAYFDIRKIVSWTQDEVIPVTSKDLDEMDARMISEVSIVQGKYGKNICVKLVSKEKAWDILAKFSRLIDVTPFQEEEESVVLDQISRRERIAALLEKRDK